MKLVYILLALAVLKCIILYKVYHSLPAIELKRRARQKDKKAMALYKVAAYQASLDVLVWGIGTAVAATLLIWSARTNWWLAAVVITVIAWLVAWARFSVEGWAGSFAAIFARPHAWFLSLMNPILKPLARLLPPGRRVHLHTGLYEKKDLLDLLASQNRQIDNRIPETDLKIAFDALQFGDKTVGSIMTPRRKITFVAANDSVGPKLVDELHQTGHDRFLVVKEVSRNLTPPVIGILYLRDLSLDDLKEKVGKVKDFMKRHVNFINEDANLRQALDAFFKSQHHLLIVVNSFEEIVGVLTLEDVLGQIIGQPILGESDDHESLRAAAAKDAQPEQSAHEEVKTSQPTEPESG